MCATFAKIKTYKIKVRHRVLRVIMDFLVITKQTLETLEKQQTLETIDFWLG